jgi:hypothetical protein
MSVDDFKATLAAGNPPAGLSVPLTALWWDAKGDWDKAHACVDSGAGESDIRVHAYLHRKEGDLGNASYWYQRIGRPLAENSLEAERDALLSDLLVGR